MTPKRVLCGIIVVSGLLRLAWASALGLGNDEAYHFLFLMNPDWSYFDHPPMLALVEAIGVGLAGGKVTPLSLRLGFILLFAGSTWLMYRLTSRLHGPRAGVLAAFGLNVTAYHTAAAGVFALPDGPLLFFWLLTLDRLAVALGLVGEPARERRELGRWLGVGLAWGLALLSKYHAIFVPAGVLLYVTIEPSARRWLRRPGPYAAAILGLLVFAPVIYWNARHDWASFLFQGGRAVGGTRFSPGTLLAALLLPALYLFPWIWARLVGLLVTGALKWRGATIVDRFLLAQAALPLATFLAVACARPVLPHWTLVGFLPVFPMLGRAWSEAFAVDPSRFRRRAALLAAVPMVAVALAGFEARTGFFQKGRPGGLGLVSAANDPTVDQSGWGDIAIELKRRGLTDRPNTFLFTNSWYYSGHLAFATRGARTPVLCYHAWDARSFAFWSQPARWVGHDGVLLTFNDRPDDPGAYDQWFASIRPLGSFEVKRAGVAIRKVNLFLCQRQLTAFPFDDLGRTIRPDLEKRSRRLAKIAQEGARSR